VADPQKIGIKTYVGNPHDTNGDCLLGRDELHDLAESDRTSGATLGCFNQAASLGQGEHDVVETFLSLDIDDREKLYQNSSSSERSGFLNMVKRWSPGLVDELRKESRSRDAGDVGDADQTQNIPGELEALKEAGAEIRFDNDVYIITGSNVPLPNGATLQEGEIRYASEDGTWFVAGGERALVSGVSMEPSTEPTAVFFESGYSYENSNYVIIDVNKKQVEVKGVMDWSDVSFHEGNPFTPVNGADKLVVRTIGGDGVLIRARDDDGLIPEINVRGAALAYIENGSNHFRIDKDSQGAELGFYKSSGDSKDKDVSTDVPVEIVVTNASGEPVPVKAKDMFKDSILGRGMSIVSNNYGQVGFKAPEDTIVPFKGFPPHDAALKLDQNGEITLDDFNEYCASRGASHIRYTGIADSTRIKQAIDSLDTLSTPMLRSLKGVDFPDPAVFSKGRKKAAYASSDGVIHLKKGRLDLPTFYHECAHIHHMHIQKTRGDSFDAKWIALGGDIYGKYVKEGMKTDDADDFSYVWHDAPEFDEKKFEADPFNYYNEYENKYSRSARYGCVRPYGASKPYEPEEAKTLEDVATYVGQFWRDPGFFEPLIDSSHPDYDPEWGPVYAGKLKLLIDEGFIPIERVPAWMTTVLYS